MEVPRVQESPRLSQNPALLTGAPKRGSLQQKPPTEGGGTKVGGDPPSPASLSFPSVPIPLQHPHPSPASSPSLNVLTSPQCHPQHPRFPSHPCPSQMPLSFPRVTVPSTILIHTDCSHSF